MNAGRNEEMKQAQGLKRVNVHELMEKFQSKREVYNFLCQDCGAYLPKVDTINIFFLKQIMRGQKDYIKRAEAKISAVPQIDGLTTEDFLNFARTKSDLMRLLPDERDWNHIDKKWLCDVLYSRDPVGIENIIKRAIVNRKDKLENNQNLIVEMKPEFESALKKCVSFSTEKGKSAFLLKPTSTQKRKRSEIENVKEFEQQLRTSKPAFMNSVKKLKTERDDLAQQVGLLKEVESQLNELKRKGYLDEKGTLIQLKPQK